MSVRTTASVRRPWADVGRGFVALVGVLALAVAVPIALISWVGWPLPAGVPTVGEVTDSLRDTYVPDSFLIKALGLVCWIVWVELMTSLIVEGIAYARGREAGRVPMSGGVQRAAARLIATTALLGALYATKGMPEVANRALRPPESITLVVDEQPALPTGAAQAETTSPATPAPVYEVVRRDTLWGIAECHLGDPFRWPEIFEMNRGVVQADGRSLQDPDLIYPGWQLQLPADAFGLPGVEAPMPPPPPPPPPPPAEPPPSVGSGYGDTTGPSEGMVLLDDDRVTRPGQPTSHVADDGAGGSGGGSGDDSQAMGGDGMVLLPDDRRRAGPSEQAQSPSEQD